MASGVASSSRPAASLGPADLPDRRIKGWQRINRTSEAKRRISRRKRTGGLRIADNGRGKFEWTIEHIRAREEDREEEDKVDRLRNDQPARSRRKEQHKRRFQENLINFRRQNAAPPIKFGVAVLSDAVAKYSSRSAGIEWRGLRRISVYATVARRG